MPRTEISRFFIERIKSFDTECLRKVKELVLEELSNRDNQKEHSKAQGILYSKITYGMALHGYDYEERLKHIAENYTETEFGKWSGIGKTTVAFAKKELEKRGLKFKETELIKQREQLCTL